MFHESAEWYDAIYDYKDYAREAGMVHALIREHKRSQGDRLLDVGCGTGRHLAFLRERYAVEGLDLDEAMLRVARRLQPEILFHRADMTDFELADRFDIVVCLFSSIGYTRTAGRMRAAVACMARHLAPGGVLIVEPWFSPEAWHPGTVHALFVDRPELKIARMNVSSVEGDISIIDFHYLVGEPSGIRHFAERHELGLFSEAEYAGAFQAAGLEPFHDREGLTGRGLYIGVRQGEGHVQPAAST